MDYGITSGQLRNVEQSFFDYSNVAKQKFRVMTLDPNSVTTTTHDPNGESTIDTADFTVTLNNQPYRAHIEYDAIYDSVHMVLNNGAGSQVYDSANSGD